MKLLLIKLLKLLINEKKETQIAMKNFFVKALSPGDTYTFRPNVTWLSVGLQDPVAGGQFELHGCGDGIGDVILLKDQAFTTPENCLMNSESPSELKVVNTGATVVNIACRY